MTAPRTIRLNPADNVIVAVDAIEAGATPEGVKALARVPRGHKMATVPIAEGQPILKFGQIIGFASKAIAPGEWVHEHNVEMHAFARDYRFAEDARRGGGAARRDAGDLPGLPPRRTARSARATTSRVLTSVNCSATVARFMGEEINRSGLLEGLSQHRRRHRAHPGRRLRHRRARARATRSSSARNGATPPTRTSAAS